MQYWLSCNIINFDENIGVPRMSLNIKISWSQNAVC
jgi:hypothetical protein